MFQFSGYTQNKHYKSHSLQCNSNMGWLGDWIGLSSVLRPCQHSIGYMGDGFYRSTQPTVSNYWRRCYKGQIKQRKQRKQQNTHMHR